MSQIAGLDSMVGAGPPGDAGGFLFPSTAIAFRFTFSGVTYYAVIRAGFRSWVLVGAPAAAPETPINAAFVVLGAGTRIVLLDATYTLAVLGISFSADSQVLEGQGRGSFIDGDALLTGINAIDLIGFVDCTVRHLSVQTEDGGGKDCYCINIYDSSRFRVEYVTIVNSDSAGIIVIADVGVNGGWLLFNTILDADEIAIVTDGMGGTYILYIEIIGNIIELTGTDGIYLSEIIFSVCAFNIVYNAGQDGVTLYAVNNSSIEANICYLSGRHGFYILSSFCDYLGNYAVSCVSDGMRLEDSNDNLLLGNFPLTNGGYGINISNAASPRNRVKDNTYNGNVSGAIQDLGTDTRLPEVTVPINDPDGNIGTHPAIVLTDGVDMTVRFEVQFPSDFQELVRARVIVVPGGTGNMRRSASTNFGKICAAENYNTHTDSIAAGEVAVTVNKLECIDLTAAFTGIELKDIVGLEFTRNGSHANDTVNANCYLLEFNMQYV